MPLSRYFNAPNKKPGEGEKVMAAMQARYGPERGKRVFYATVNRMRKGSPAERAAQPAAPPGSKSPGSALMSARKRRRGRSGALSGPPKATGGPIYGASSSTTRVGY